MNTSRVAFQQQTGFTLIELLVAMVIGVLVILGATQLFIASQQNYRVTTALADMQDTGRFALEVLSRELRQADFKGGCAPSQINVSVPGLARTTSIAPAPALQGFASTQNTTLSSAFEQPLADAQVIAYRAAGTPIKGSIKEVSNPTFRFAPADTTLVHNAAGQVLLLQSAQRCELFLNAATQPDRLQKSTTGWPAGSAQAASLSYTQNQAVTLTALTSGVYYLGRDPTNADRPSLMRLDTSTATPVNEVLASHVVALRARFLKNDAYVTVNDVSANEWQNVRAVRVSLIVQSERTDLRQTPTTINTGNFRSNPFSANDGRLYQVFTTTIDLRNRS